MSAAEEGDISQSASLSELTMKRKSGAATFGPPRGASKPQPAIFLKKRSTEPTPQPRESSSVPVGEAPRQKLYRKPALDTTCPLITENETEKDFITRNALHAIQLKSKAPKCGQPDYLSKPEYGRVPEYLVQANLERQERNTQLRNTQTLRLQQEQDARMKQLPAEERTLLLRQLKSKWGNLNAAFQKLPLQLDTPSKLKHKELLEAELAQTEADIHLLQLREEVMICYD